MWRFILLLAVISGASAEWCNGGSIQANVTRQAKRKLMQPICSMDVNKAKAERWPPEEDMRGLLFQNFWQCPTNWDLANPEFKSQVLEDQTLFEMFWKSPLKTHGIFLEMGALDGSTYSNSWFFEKHLDWRGILIEGQPANSARLFATRRPHAVKFAGTVCGTAGGVIEIAGDAAIAGKLESMPAGLRKAYDRNNVAKVWCYPLNKYLAHVGVKHIDLWSLDVEGAELAILQDFDFSAVSVHVLIVEGNEKQDEIEKLMISKGFERRKDYCAGVLPSAPRPTECSRMNDIYENKNFKLTPCHEMLWNHYGTQCNCALFP